MVIKCLSLDIQICPIRIIKVSLTSFLSLAQSEPADPLILALPPFVFAPF